MNSFQGTPANAGTPAPKAPPPEPPNIETAETSEIPPKPTYKVTPPVIPYAKATGASFSSACNNTPPERPKPWIA